MNRGAKYYASFIVGVANSMEYRFDFFMNLLSTIFPIIMQVFLWNVMFSGAGTDRMYGYTFSQMILYVVMAGAVSKFTSTGVENAVNDDIHSGGLAKFVVKPVNYIFFRLTGAIGQKFSAMVTMLGLTAASLFVLRFIVNFSIKPESVILFIFSLAIAVILNFYIWNFFHAISVAIMVLSGGVFPLSVFGERFVAVSKFIPLSYTINYPIQILAGTVPSDEACQVLVIQVVWILVFILLANLLWKNGIRKYVAVGG